MQELLLRRTPAAHVRCAALGVPSFLALTSERLLFGTVRFVTIAALHAIVSLEAQQGVLGDELLLANLDGPGAAQVHPPAPPHTLRTACWLWLSWHTSPVRAAHAR